jgi:hypothetical protein
MEGVRGDHINPEDAQWFEMGLGPCYSLHFHSKKTKNMGLIYEI